MTHTMDRHISNEVQEHLLVIAQEEVVWHGAGARLLHPLLQQYKLYKTNNCNCYANLLSSACLQGSFSVLISIDIETYLFFDLLSLSHHFLSARLPRHVPPGTVVVAVPVVYCC